MKFTIKVLEVLLFGTVLNLWVFPLSSSLGADITSRLAQGEIVIKVQEAPGSGAGRGEATGVVEAPPEKVWQVVLDANNYQEFLPKIIRSRLLRVEEMKRVQKAKPAKASKIEALLSSNPPDVAHFRIPGRKQYTGYFYGHLELPWPLKERWYITRVRWDESQAVLHTYTSSWSLITGNLREYRGEWKVEPFEGNRTRLTYRVVTDTGAFVPKFLVEKFTSETLPQIITGVRQRVASQLQPELPG